MEVQNMNVPQGAAPSSPPPVVTAKVEEVRQPKAQEAGAAKALSELKVDQEEQPREDLSSVVAGMNAVLENSGNHIRFMQHKESGRMMVEIVDDRTSEVVRTIPNKELLDLAARIGDMIGVMVDRTT